MPDQSPSEVVEEVRHCLVFSHAFFDAFKARTDRVRFWKFLVLVLEKTKKDRKMNNDFTWTEIEEIAGVEISQTTYWRKELIKKFKNNKGPFLQRLKSRRSKLRSSNTGHRKQGRHKDIKFYELTDNFGVACGTYLGVVAKDGLGLTGAHFDEFVKAGDKRFRELIDFLRENYWPSWYEFLGEVGDTTSNKEALLKEVRKISTYWTMVLVVWEQFETKPDDPYNQMGLHREVFAGQREIGLREVTRCMNFLVREGLLIEKRQKADEPTYSFNEKHKDSMRRYIAAVSKARDKLMATFAGNVQKTPRT